MTWYLLRGFAVVCAVVFIALATFSRRTRHPLKSLAWSAGLTLLVASGALLPARAAMLWMLVSPALIAAPYFRALPRRRATAAAVIAGFLGFIGSAIVVGASGI